MNKKGKKGKDTKK